MGRVNHDCARYRNCTLHAPQASNSPQIGGCAVHDHGVKRHLAIRPRRPAKSNRTVALEALAGRASGLNRIHSRAALRQRLKCRCRGVGPRPRVDGQYGCHLGGSAHEARTAQQHPSGLTHNILCASSPVTTGHVDVFSTGVFYTSRTHKHAARARYPCRCSCGRSAVVRLCCSGGRLCCSGGI